MLERQDAEHPNDDNVQLQSFQRAIDFSLLADQLAADLKFDVGRFLAVSEVCATLHNSGLIRCTVRCHVDSPYKVISTSPSLYESTLAYLKTLNNGADRAVLVT